MNKPFEGDSYIKGEIIALRDKFDLKYCVETGCQYGSTTLELYDIFKNVVTIEADTNYYHDAKKRFHGLYIGAYLGFSHELIRGLILPDNVFYYLDAHGCEIGGCPLKEELEAIAAKNYDNVCIAIHDFKVPGTDFGFDTYDYELSYEEVKPYLDKIYPNGFDYHYNSQADGAYRGVAYFYPIKTKS
jgi:hypothetical protein